MDAQGLHALIRISTHHIVPEALEVPLIKYVEIDTITSCSTVPSVKEPPSLAQM
jgi:hypothetical protein